MKRQPFLPKKAWIVLAPIILVLLFMIVIYPIKLSHLSISTNPADWGVLGDYYNFIISAINTTAVIILSYKVYKSQTDRDIWERKLLELQDKPALIFVAHNGEYYKLYNMGKGTAHKIIIGRVPKDQQEIEKPPYKAYSIPPNAHIVVDWATNTAILYAHYESVEGQPYLVKCQGDINDDLTSTEEGASIIEYLIVNADRRAQINMIMP